MSFVDDTSSLSHHLNTFMPSSLCNQPVPLACSIKHAPPAHSVIRDPSGLHRVFASSFYLSLLINNFSQIPSHRSHLAGLKTKTLFRIFFSNATSYRGDLANSIYQARLLAFEKHASSRDIGLLSSYVF